MTLIEQIQQDCPDVHPNLLKYVKRVEAFLPSAKIATSIEYVEIGAFFSKTLFLHFNQWVYCLRYVEDADEEERCDYTVYNPQETKALLDLLAAK